MNNTNEHRTANQIALAYIAVICYVIQPGCATNRASQLTKDSHPVIRSSSTGMQLVAVEAGTFAMGSPPDEPERENNETQHQVTLTRPFYVGVYEVTQGEFTHVMGFNPSTVRGSDRLPVETVTWFDAVSFCNRLSKLDGLEAAYMVSNIEMEGPHITNAVVRWISSSAGYRLPTEAEWEFACRAGTRTPFSFGDTVTSDQANFDGLTPYNGGARGQFRKRTLEVDAFPANAFGLYQMSGNVFEWVWDYYAQYPTDPQRDPIGPEDGTLRVRRGGAYGSPGGHMRSAVRHGVPPRIPFFHMGFRAARSIVPTNPKGSFERSASRRLEHDGA